MSVQAASIFVGSRTSVPSIPLRWNSSRSPGILGILGWILVPVIAFVLQFLVPLLALALWSLDAPTAETFRAAEALCFVVAVILFGWACRHPTWIIAGRFGLVRPRGRYVLLGLAALVLCWAFIAVLTLSGFTAANSSYEPPTAFALALHVFGIVVIAPVYEELVHRGLVFHKLASSRLGVGGAIVVTSLVWALLHLNKTWSGAATVFAFGLALGFLRWQTGSTWVTIALHAAHNAIVAAVFISVYAAS